MRCVLDIPSVRQYQWGMQPIMSETVAAHVARDGRWLRFRTRRALFIWLKANEPEVLS